MTKIARRGHEAAASLLVPSLALLALSLALLAAALFPAAGLAAEEGEAPVLTFSPSPLDFGKVTVGTETGTTGIEVQNVGSVAGVVAGIAAEGGDSGDFKIAGSSCGQIDPGQSCTVWVAFAPGAVATRESSLVVQLKESPSQTLPLAGTGVAAQLAFNPGSYDFGIQRVNRGESSASFQLTNTGEAMTQLGSVGIGGKDTGNFWINGNDCWGGRQLQPGESCGVQVFFNPWDTVAYEAEVQAYANGSLFTAALSGFGGRAQVEPSSFPVEFGAVTVGAIGPVETIVFTNHGNLPGNFFIGIVAGGAAGSFRLLDEDCSLAPLAPAGTCVAHVRFVPQDSGPKLARLALFGDDDGGTMAVLSGEGVAPAATLAPSGFDFGAQAAGGKSAAHGFVVRNDGATALELGTVAIVGADADQFALAGDECTGEILAPGAECAVRVRFTPDSEGGKAARLRVGGFTATLAGTGTAAAASAEPRQDGAFDHPEPPPPPRPWRKARNRRFVRGETLSAGKLSRPHRVKVRPNSIPR